MRPTRMPYAAIVLCATLAAGAAAAPATAPAPATGPTTQAAALRIGGLPAQEWLHTDLPICGDHLRGRLWVLGVLEPSSPLSLAAAETLASLRARWAPRGIEAILLTTEPADVVRASERIMALRVPVGTHSILPMLRPIAPLPVVHLVGPEQEVLWSGPVDELEPVLAEACQTLTPEGLTPRRAEEVAAWLDLARAAMDRQDFFTSVGLAQTAAAATPANHPLHAQAAQLLAGLQRIADEQLAAAERLLSRRQGAEAYAALQDVAEGFYGLPAAERAIEMSQQLRDDPRLWSEVLRRRDEESARQALQMADQACQAERYAEAQRYYQLIERVYGRTEAAPAARRMLRDLQRDATIAPQLARQQAEPDAPILMSLATRYSQMGRFALARRYYEQIVRSFPNTPYALEAQRRLGTLPTEAAATQPQ